MKSFDDINSVEDLLHAFIESLIADFFLRCGIDADGISEEGRKIAKRLGVAFDEDALAASRKESAILAGEE